MSVPNWYAVFKGGNLYNEGPEQETRWVRDALYAGILFGIVLTYIFVLIIS